MSRHPETTVKINLIDYVQVIVKRSRLILKLTFGTAVCVALYSLTMPNIYSATAMLLPVQDNKGLTSALTSQLGGLATLAGNEIESSSTAEMYVSMLKSRTVKDPIIERFKLKDVYDQKYMATTSAALDKNSHITVGKKDGIITITVDDKSPKRASDLANAYIDELRKLTVKLNVTGAAENRSFLQDRLAGAKADLVKAEEALKVFQQQNKSIEMPEQTKATIAGVAELKAALALKEVELSTLTRSRTENSQEVKDMKIAIHNLKSQIYNMESGTGVGAMPKLGSVPQLSQEYVRLMREFKTQEALVELLTKQFEMAAFSEAKTITPFQVIQEARVPELKSRPERAKIVVMAVVTALFISLVLVFLMEYIDRMSEDEKMSWKEILSAIPLVGKRIASS